MKKLIAFLVLICVVGSFCGCEQNNTASKTSNSSEDYLRMGMYYQQLGKESYDPKIGIFFKDVDEFAQKNYENANYFDNWMKSNDSGLYKVMASDMEGYDFRLELDNHVDFKELVFYVKAIEGKDKLELFEYTPDAEFTMCSYGTYLSEKYIKDNGYTEFDWSGMN